MHVAALAVRIASWGAGLFAGSLLGLCLSCSRPSIHAAPEPVANSSSEVLDPQVDVSNTTRIEFDLPLAEVRRLAIAGLARSRQYSDPIFPRPDRSHREPFGIEFDPLLTLETREKTLFSGPLFDDPANAADLFLHNFDTPIWRSPVYRGPDGPVPFEAAFQVHFEAISSGRTVVDVRAIDCEVVTDRKFGLGPCGPGFTWQSKAVEPTGVEEARVLHYIAHALGRADLPQIVIPAPIDLRALAR